MKKNISINISGIIFHIEEDGYESLRKYLDSINKYFSSFEDSSEILADIESRIADFLLYLVSRGAERAEHEKSFTSAHWLRFKSIFLFQAPVVLHAAGWCRQLRSTKPGV